jgi:hypothetical protein
VPASSCGLRTVPWRGRATQTRDLCIVTTDATYPKFTLAWSMKCSRPSRRYRARIDAWIVEIGGGISTATSLHYTTG